MFEDLQAQFDIRDRVAVVAGTNGLPKVVLTHGEGARAEVYLQGAHVTSWVPAGGTEVFFVSRAAHFAPEKAIRGGIPVIFPQFGSDGPLPQHGFARTSPWELASTAESEHGLVCVTLRLADSPATRAQWPHPFTLDLEVRLDAQALTLALRVINHDDDDLPFQAALHTYFAVADITQTTVRGLQGVSYIDALQGNAQFIECAEAISIDREVDRIYLSTPDRLEVADSGHGRTIHIEKTGMPDVVVWNPWIAKAQRMADFGDDEYPGMLCVETGNMGRHDTLAPLAVWEGTTTFSISEA